MNFDWNESIFFNETFIHPWAGYPTISSGRIIERFAKLKRTFDPSRKSDQPFTTTSWPAENTSSIITE